MVYRSSRRDHEIPVIIRYPDYTQQAFIKRRGIAYDVIFWGVIDRGGEYMDIPSVNDQQHRRSIINRSVAIAEIAQDVRLHSRAMHTRAALIAEVMARYGVTYSNARTMICRARHGKAQA